MLPPFIFGNSGYIISQRSGSNLWNDHHEPPTAYPHWPEAVILLFACLLSTMNQLRYVMITTIVYLHWPQIKGTANTNRSVYFYNFDHKRKQFAFHISLNRTLALTIGPEISTLLGRTERALVKNSIQL